MTFKSKSTEETEVKKLLSREPSFMYDTTVEAFNTIGTIIEDNTEDRTIEIENDDTILIEESIPFTETEVVKFEYIQDDIDNINNSTRTNLESERITGIAIPNTANSRRLSTISVEETNKISSTPEGQKYFMQREESFVAKVDRGEVENLAVEISDFYSLETSASQSSLSVRPFVVSPEAEIVVADLGSQSSLMVKPIEKTIHSFPCSSYEHIYDKIEAEEHNETKEKLSATEILSSLGDKFVGTHEIPDFYSSFEELYSKSIEEGAETSESSVPMTAGERWSAPAGTVEPPILDDQEFSNRLQPLQAKIDHHWDEMEILMSTETLTGEG